MRRAVSALAWEPLKQINANICLSAHSAIGKMVGLSDTEILESRQAHAREAEPNAALHFSRLLVEKRGAVSEADINAARKDFPSSE